MKRIFLTVVCLFASVIGSAEITGMTTFPGGSDRQVQYGKGGLFEGVSGSCVTATAVRFDHLEATGTLKVGIGAHISTFTPSGLSLEYGLIAASATISGVLSAPIITTLTTSTNTINASTISLQSQLGIMGISTASLNSRLVTVGIDTASISGLISTLTISTNSLNTSTFSLQSQINGIGISSAITYGQLAFLAISTTSLQTQIGTLGVSTKSIQTTVDALGVSTNSLGSLSVVDALGISTKTIIGIVDVLGVSTNAIGGTVNVLGTSTNTLKGLVDTLGISTYSLQNQVGTIGVSTNAMSAAIDALGISTGSLGGVDAGATTTWTGANYFAGILGSSNTTRLAANGGSVSISSENAPAAFTVLNGTFVVRSNGSFDSPSMPYGKKFRSGAAMIVSNGAYTRVQWNNDTYNIGGISTSTTGGGFVIPVAGGYHCVFRMGLDNNGTGIRVIIIKKDNTTVSSAGIGMGGVADYIYQEVSYDDPSLTVGNVLDTFVYQDSGTDRNMGAAEGGMFFMCEKNR